MRRTQIQLDDPTYAALRERAYRQGKSMSALIRETLAETFATERAAARRLTMKDFASVGIRRSRQGKLAPVSVRHDEALAEAIWEHKRPRR